MEIKMDLREIGWWYKLDLYGSGQRSMPGSSEHGIELSGATKFWEFVEWLSNCWLHTSGLPPWS
jgi:hypothetical protein